VLTSEPVTARAYCWLFFLLLVMLDVADSGVVYRVHLAHNHKPRLERNGINNIAGTNDKSPDSKHLCIFVPIYKYADKH
jgi:hypothetical protein